MKKISLILLTVFIVITLGSGLSSIAFADTVSYTDVLDDLRKDETFDVSKYAENTKDYSLQVIQIAEGKDGAVFVYVYQPSGDSVRASEIRLSTTIGDDLAPKDYRLTLLNRNGTLAKYKIENLSVKADAERYYDIIQIARPWNSSIDKLTGNNNTTSTVPYSVGKLFTARTTDGKVTYGETHEEVITVTAKYCGYIRNFTGWVYHKVNTDSHFIAFDTDRLIEKLMEAEVTYSYYMYEYKKEKLTGLTVAGTTKQMGDVVTGKIATLKADASHTVPSVGWFGKEYTWSEIQSVEEFSKQEQLTKSVKKEMQGKKWVLRFWLSPVVEMNTGSLTQSTVTAYHVSDASILRLKFETNGIVYNLGVVDNKQTEGSTPSNRNPDDNLKDGVGDIKDGIQDIIDFFNKVKNALIKAWNWICANRWVIPVGIVAIGVVIGLIKAFIKYGFVAVFKVIGNVLWLLVKGLFYIVTLPAWLIIWIVRAIRKRKE